MSPQTPQSEAQPITHADVRSHDRWYTPLCRVTTTSKILAAIVMIMLPFLGGYVGYRLASDQEVTVVELAEVDSRLVDSTMDLDVGGKYTITKHICPECDSVSNEIYYDIPVLVGIENGDLKVATITPYYELNESRLLHLRDELARGEIRFKATGWYFDEVSSYVFDGVGVHYRPYDENGKITEDKELVTSTTEAYSVGRSFFINGVLYRDGVVEQQVSFARGIYHGDLFFVTDTTMYMDNVGVYKKIFDDIDGERMQLRSEFEDKAFEARGLTPLTDGQFLYFSDGNKFYCPHEENPVALPEPIYVEFNKHDGGPDSLTHNSRWFTDSQDNYYVLEFRDSRGIKYDASCTAAI